jgi:hypothetical protein
VQVINFVKDTAVVAGAETQSGAGIVEGHLVVEWLKCYSQMATLSLSVLLQIL